MSKLLPVVLIPIFLFAQLAYADSDVPASFTQACKCTHCKGKARWKEKTDTAEPPTTPKPAPLDVADIVGWDGPGVPIRTNDKKPGAERIADEEKWYTLTGKVVLVRLEGDGDLHVQLEAAPGSPKPKSGEPTYAVVEIPPSSATKSKSVAGDWCNFRTTVLSWTNFDSLSKPIVTSDKLLTMQSYPVITVTGKAFYDVDHAPADHKGNHRPKKMHDIAVWEIHPVMELKVDSP